MRVESHIHTIIRLEILLNMFKISLLDEFLKNCDFYIVFRAKSCATFAGIDFNNL